MQAWALHILAVHHPLHAQFAGVVEHVMDLQEVLDAQVLHPALDAVQSVLHNSASVALADDCGGHGKPRQLGTSGCFGVAQLHANAVAVDVVPGGLFGVLEEAVEGHRGGPEAEGLQQPAIVVDLGAEVGNHGDARVVGLHEPGNLPQHGGGCRARVAREADADAVHAGVAQVLRLSARLYAAREDVYALVLVLHALDEVHRVREDSLVCVQAEEVDSSIDYSLDAFPGILVARADRRCHTQRPVRVHGGEGVLQLLLEVPADEEGNELVVDVHDGQLGDLGHSHRFSCLHDGHRLMNHNRVLGHDGSQLRLPAVGGFEVASCDDPRDPAAHPTVVGDRDAADAEFRLHRPSFLDSTYRLQRMTVEDEARLVLLYPQDHGGLRLDALLPVDDADAPHLRKGDRHLRLRHGVYGTAHDWQVEGHVPRELARQADRCALDALVSWQEDEVIPAVALRGMACEDLLCRPALRRLRHGRCPPRWLQPGRAGA
mmetsp:Transcript_49064/g.110351  ORF Transcript_49064/g.110351 Transcript_49064/m.110351 type:complete len:488 (+) Transcript_49064:147-1610(+)